MKQQAQMVGRNYHRTKRTQWLVIMAIMMAVLANVSMAKATESQPLLPNTYQDTQNHWAQEAIARWSEKGIVQGYAGHFRPDDTVTRGELAVILDKIMHYQTQAENTFSDLPEAFYTQPLLKAYSAGIITDQDNMLKPEEQLTRQQAFVMIAKALGVEAKTAGVSTDFADDQSIPAEEKPYIVGLQQRVLVSGDQGKFWPQRVVTRAEIVKVLDNAIGDIYSADATLTQSIPNDLIINTPDVVLTGATVAGDVIIAEGVGNGHVTLNNVAISGSLIIRGGGENSVKLHNSTIEKVSVEKQEGAVRVLTAEDTHIAQMSVYTKAILEGNFHAVSLLGSTDVAIRGNIDTLTVDKPAAIALQNGKIAQCNLNRSAAGSALTIAKNASVATLQTSAKATITVSGELNKMTVNKGAENTLINGSGKIAQIFVDVENVAVNNQTAQVTVGTAVQNVTLNGSTVAPGSSTTPQTGGSGGGSSSSGSSTPVRIVSVESVDAALLRVTLSGATEKALDKSAFSIICTGGGKDMTIVNVRTTDQKVYDISTAYYQENTYNLEITLANATRINKDFVVKLDCPTISSQTMQRTGATTATFTYVSDMPGTFYYGIAPKSLARAMFPPDKVPTVAELIADGVSSPMNQQMNTIQITGLEANTPYTIYYVAKDTQGRTTLLKQLSLEATPVEKPLESAVHIVSITAHEDFGEKMTDYKVWFTIELDQATRVPLISQNFALNCPKGALSLGKVETIDNKTYQVYLEEGTIPFSNNTYTVAVTLPDGVAQSTYYLDLMAPEIDSVDLEWVSETELKATVKAKEPGKLYYKVLATVAADTIAPKDPTEIYASGQTAELSYGNNEVILKNPTAGQYFCCATEDQLGNRQQYYTYTKIPIYQASEPPKPDELQIISATALSKSSVQVTLNQAINIGSIENDKTSISGLSGKGLYEISLAEGGKVCQVSITNGWTIAPGIQTIQLVIDGKYLSGQFQAK